MNTKELINLIQTSPTEVEFDQVMAVIDSDYDYTPTRFYNGLGENEVINEAGTNEGSCKIFAFADLNDLNEAQTLACFGKYYRQEVLLDLGGDSHANIRNFMKFGWEGLHFDNPPLAVKE
ncbi:MAG: HopJ type III effector protein [Gammaproteobacteria bacterium]|nr:HopJ type III effector protein [Gammaproteobacteria bacterium]MDH5659470.1 HopJ type III effector protein [Gammaproteobacteria bacterium]